MMHDCTVVSTTFAELRFPFIFDCVRPLDDDVTNCAHWWTTTQSYPSMIFFFQMHPC